MFKTLTQRLAPMAIALLATVAHADTYPSRPITLIVPFTPGASADGIARIISKELSSSLGQPVVVDNKPGSGGALGLMAAAKGAPDGYTISMGATGAIAVNPHLPDAPPLNPGKDLTPIAKVADIPLVLVAGANAGYGNLQAFLRASRNTKGGLTYGTSGQYTSQHLAGELLAAMTKIQLDAVPYRGSGPAVNDLLGGQLPAAVVGPQATGNAAFINLHSAAGVGNAMGNIYTAFKNLTPMVIVAGQQSRSIQLYDPYLNSKQVTELPKPYVKWSVEPARAEDVPQAIARAYYTAMQAPRGPVMVSVPADDWDATCHPVIKREIGGRVAADPVAIEQVSSLLAASKNPAFLVGASVDREGAWGEMVELAERCSAAVYVAPLSSRCSFPEDHQLFQGFLPAVRAQIRHRLEGHDLVLVVGAPAFTYHVAGDGPHLPEGATLALLTEDPEVAAWAPEGMVAVGSVLLSLKTLLSALPAGVKRQLPPKREAPPPADPQSLTVASVLNTLSELRNPEHAIVEEAPTARVVMHQYLPITRPRTFYTMASGGLGFGMPAAVGLALAGHHERVICVIGDGSTMYSPQALWTAAQKQLNVTFIVINNQRYAALKRFAGVLNFPPEEKLVGIELPGLDFVSLAQGHGCPAQRVTDAHQLRAKLAEVLSCAGPSLLEVQVC